MPVKNMTDRWIAGAKAINGKRTTYSDKKSRGLHLRITPTGLKSWSVIYRRKSDNKQRWLTLGRYPELKLADARQKAQQAILDADGGADPAGEKQRDLKTETFEQLANEWLTKYAKKHKAPGSWKEDERKLKVDILPVIGGMKANQVKRTDIYRIFEAVTERGPVTANRTLTLMRTIYNWATRIPTLDIENNPAAYIDKNPEKPRDRYLETDKEIATYWQTVEVGGMCNEIRDMLKLVLLTGQRIGEARQIRKSDIDLEQNIWNIRTKIAKNRNAHRVPLAPHALEIITNAMNRTTFSEYVFPSPKTGQPMEEKAGSRAWRRVRGGTDLEDVHVHDMRHTLVTGLAKMGISEELAGRMVNHSGGQTSITAKVYNQFSYDDEKRRAFEAWESHIMAIVGGRTVGSNVVAIRS